MIHNAMPFPILIGDIGGTNARFALLESVDDTPDNYITAQTADYATIDDAIRACILDKGARPKSAILAVAAPIDGDEVDLTNCPWVVRPKVMIAEMGFEEVLLVNDFEAQALAVAALGPEHRQLIGGPNVAPVVASRVALGPGTGLGVAGLIHAQDTWVPVPGEGGHIDMGPRSARDYQIFPHLEALEGRISGEQLLCGRGLMNIYRSICTVDGVEPVLKTPAEITANGLPGGENAQARETVSLFSTYLGRIAGDLALIFMAHGGVYLAGGISLRIIPALKMPEFRAAFEDKAPHTHLLREIPTYVITHPMAALAGLADYACNPVRFGISTDGRYWRA